MKTGEKTFKFILRIIIVNNLKNMEEILKSQKFNAEEEKTDNELIEFWGNRLRLLEDIEDKDKEIEMARIFENLAKYIIKNPNIDLPIGFPNDIVDLSVVSFPIARRVYQTCGTFYEDCSEFFDDLVNDMVLIHKFAKNFNEEGGDVDVEAEYSAIVSDMVTCGLLRRKNSL